MRQEPVLTVWVDGTWKVWGAMDAHYAKDDEGYLVTIPLKEIAAEQKNEQGMSDRIVSTPGTLGGKPRIAGHRIAVQHVAIWHHQMGMSVATIAEKWELDEADVMAALAYYDQHRAAIDARTAEEEALLQNYLARRGRRGRDEL